MRPIVLTQVGAGQSAAAPMNIYTSPFNIGIGVEVTGTVSYTIEHTFDDPFANPPFFQAQYTYTQSTLAIVVPPTPPSPYSNANTNGQNLVLFNGTSTGLAVGQAIAFSSNGVLYSVQSINTTVIAGQSLVTVAPALSQTVGTTTTVYTVAPAAPFTPTLTWFPHPTLVTQTANADGNYAFPVRAVRLNVLSGSGTATAYLLSAGIA